MGKRKLPFGYRLDNGDVIIQNIEADCVRWIFTAYLQGASLKEISEALNERQRIRYASEKPWNKNMVARILQDRRYSGDALYPEIISEGLYQSVQRRRTARQGLPRKSQAQKTIRILGGGKAAENVEVGILAALNHLIQDPDAIQCPKQEKPDQTSLFRTQRELDAVMAHQPIDEDKASQLILRQAEAEYAMLGNDEYETERLRRLFSKTEPITELSADLLRQAVAKISVEIKKVSVTLKNNQLIEVSDLS